MKTIVAFGNPLLDTTIFIRDNLLLNKYDLKEDGQKEITEDEMLNLTKDIESYKQRKCAGGCAQNSLRVLQWLLNKQCQAFIFGSVGKDEDAQTLKRLLEQDGVQTRYIEQPDLPTGKTVALINNQNRSLVAYIGAAEKLRLVELLEVADFVPLLKRADYVYVEGFFLTERIETAKYILDLANREKKKMVFNVSGDYVCNAYPEAVKYFVDNSDIVFGSKKEFEALAKILNIESVERLMEQLFESEKVDRSEGSGKIVVITDGSKSGRYFYGGGKFEVFHVAQMSKNEVKDTTGAGDAFLAGFVAGLCMNKSLEDCAKVACYSASQIIKKTGCTLPKFQPDVW